MRRAGDSLIRQRSVSEHGVSFAFLLTSAGRGLNAISSITRRAIAMRTTTGDDYQGRWRSVESGALAYLLPRRREAVTLGPPFRIASPARGPAAELAPPTSARR
jgi:hypothetical protein